MILPTYEFAYNFRDRMVIVKKNKQGFVINLHEERISPIFAGIRTGLAGFICRKEENKPIPMTQSPHLPNSEEWQPTRSLGCHYHPTHLHR